MSTVHVPVSDSAAPTCENVSCPCIRDGQPATKEFTFVWQDDGEALPRLNIFSQKRTRKAGWAHHDVYMVEEIPSPLGRAFLLHRSVQAIANDPDHDERYGVLIANEQDQQCECKGFQAHGRCKHITAIRWALQNGHLDDPRASAPSESFPSPEQIASEAGMNMPF